MPCKIVFLTIAFATIVQIIKNPNLLPQYRDFFWLEKNSFNIIFNTLYYIGNLLIHELFHLIAARSFGIPGRMEFDTRLNNLVIQTNVTGMWALERKERRRVYLAGIIWDTVPIIFAVLALSFYRLDPLITGFCKMVVMMNLLGILWQFEFFMRTDIYFVVNDYFKCGNLYGDSLTYLKNQYYFIIKSKKFRQLDELNIQHERIKSIRLFSYFLLVGSSMTLIVAIFFGLPIAIELFFKAIESIFFGYQNNEPLVLFDGLVVLGIEGGIQFLFLKTFYKKYRLQIHRLFRRTT